MQSGESMINRKMKSPLPSRQAQPSRPRSALGSGSGSREIAQKVSFDKSQYHIEWGGQLEGRERAETRLKLIIGMVLALMMVLSTRNSAFYAKYFSSWASFRSRRLAGLMALHATGTTLNVASGVGFIALFGVAVMNGVIMVADLNRVRVNGLSLFEAVLAGAGERLRPVLMTASVATVGMLPAALATGVGSDVERNLATVVAGGLIPATLLTLFIVPTFYFVIERRAALRYTGNDAAAQNVVRET